MLNWTTANHGNAAVTTAFVEHVTIINQTTGATITEQDVPYDPNAAGNAAIAAGAGVARTLSITLPDGTPAVGTLLVRVTTDSTGVIFERNASGTGESNDTSAVNCTAVLAAYPDLSVSNVSGPVNAQSGQTVTVTWTESNTGNAAATGSWADLIALTAGPAGTDIPLLTVQQINQPIAAGASVTRAAQVLLPANLQGHYSFAVTTDAGNSIFELNTANNRAVAASGVVVAAALTVTLGSASISESGGAAALQVTVTRSGDISKALTVALAGDATALTLPAQVTIAAGQAGVTFTAGAVDDGLVTGTRNTVITARAIGYAVGTVSVAELNTDTPALTLTPAAILVEETDGSINAVLTRNTPTDTALTVSLISDTTYKMTAPPTVTFAVGQSSINVPLTILDDGIIEGSRTVNITANADGYTAGAAQIIVNDTNTPQLTIAVGQTVVSEAAGPNATTLTISIPQPLNQDVEIALKTDVSQIRIPSRVTILAGQTSVSVPVAVADLAQLIGGSRIVAIQASVSDAILRLPIPGTAVTTLLQINGSVGPQLAVALTNSTVAGGTSTTGTITRSNTDLSAALTVTLTSNDTTEATVPTIVTIAAGQASATFTANGLNDGSPDHTANITLVASAANFIDGSAALMVTNRNLPDLVVSALNVPANVVAGQPLTFSYTVTNTGLAPATAPFTDNVYFSSDVLLSSDDTLATTASGVTLAAGASYTNTITVSAPANPGALYVIIQSDAGGAVAELSEANNLRVSDVPITVNPSYRATVAASVHQSPQGAPITLSGTAYDAISGKFAAFEEVSVRITTASTIRELLAVTDPNGNYHITFQPLATEAGDYTVTAAQPGVPDSARVVQDSFSIIGMNALTDGVNITTLPGTTVSGSFVVQNLSSVALTGLSASIAGLPATAKLTIQPIANLAANGSVTVKYSFVSSAQIVGNAPIVITSTQGATVSVPFSVTVIPLHATLVADPGYLNTGMVVGTTSLVTFDIHNTGGADSGPLTVAIPSAPWLSLASPTTIDNIAAGGVATVTLRLAPGVYLPLQEYTGNVTVTGATTAISEAFTFRAVSTAVGDVSVSVEDEYTYFAADKPMVAGAVVTLSDPYTFQTIASATTDTTGIVHFTGVAAGTYAVTITAPQHDTFNGSIDVKPGTDNTQSDFLHRQLVTYNWTVVPTQIADHYQIVLQSTFETAVPAPVVTIDQPLLVPLVLPGQTTQTSITLTNHGLIAANNVQITLPQDDDFDIESLVSSIPVLPAMSSVTIPITVRAKTDAPNINSLMATASITQQSAPLDALGQSQPVETEGKYSTLSKCLGITAVYSYVCDGDKYQQVNASLDPIFCAEDVNGAGNSVSNLLSGGETNLADVGCDVLDALLTCAGADDCVQALIISACKGIVGGLEGAEAGPVGAAAGAAAGIAGAWTDILACLCKLGGIGDGGTATSSDAGGGGFGGGGGGGGGGAGSPYLSSVGYTIPSNCAGTGTSSASTSSTSTSSTSSTSTTSATTSTSSTEANATPVQTASNAVCATVRLEIDQQAVITRTAFQGTLDVGNGSTTPITDLSLSINIVDSNGNSANDLFVTNGPTQTGFTGAFGSLQLAAGADGKITFIFVPTNDAAPNTTVTYEIGGELHYIQNGVAIDVPLSPAKIDVNPDARLKLDYFYQRDVIGDDPFTPQVEASEPFYLGLQVTNEGKGSADDLTITSSQPKIVENQKGLLIDFKIIGSQVGAQDATPSLTADLGSVAPGQVVTADWALLSSLQGKFEDFSASFTHEDDAGDLRTSLIDSVTVHELIALVHVTTPTDDGVADFLVNDIPDANHDPDTLYLSTGGQAPVSMATAISVSGAGGLTETLTATQAAGWSYIEVADPAPGLKLVSVTRSDGKVIPIDGMVWRTDRTFPANAPEPIDENLLHILDFNGTGSYTLNFVSDDNTPPAITSITDLSATVQTAAVGEIDVQLSKLIDDTTFTTSALMLTRNGVSLPTSGLTITDAGAGLFKITGLATQTGADGVYILSVDASKLSDPAGNTGAGITTTQFAVSTSGAAVLTAITPVSPAIRNTAVDSVDFTFSEPIDPATLNVGAVTLTRNGTAIPLDSRVSIVQLSSTSFRISGLTTLTGLAGAYALSVDGSTADDPGGVAAAGKLTDTWTTDLTGPVVQAIEQITTNPRNTIVQTLDVTLSEPIDPASFDYHAITITQNGGPNMASAAITVTQIDATHYQLAHFNDSFNAATGIDGTYKITVNGATLRDLAGNAGTGTVTESWVLDTVAPPAATNLSISPDRGTSATDGITNTTSFTVNGSLAVAGLTVHLTDMNNGDDLGYGTVTGSSFAAAVQLAGPGAHHLRVRTVDGAGNTTDAFIDVFIDETAPVVTALSAVSPDPRSTPVDTIDVTFSEAIDPASFTAAAVVLKRDGTTLTNTGITVTSLGNNVWAVGGLTSLTTPTGAYDFSINGTLLHDVAGNAAVDTIHDTWTDSATVKTGFGGVVFQDYNGDGVRDFGASVPVYDQQETGLAGWTVFLDTNGNGKLDTGEQSAVTAADGSYSFAALAAGSYTVVTIGQAGYQQTAPLTGKYTITVGDDEYETTSYDFGEFLQGTISGTVFNDADADGVLDHGEAVLAGRTVFLDANGNGVLDAGERSVVTGADGTYSFTGIGPGNTLVGEVTQAGFGLTTPETPIAVGSGYVGTNLNIGNVALATITGNVYNDATGAAAKLAGDAGLKGWDRLHRRQQRWPAGDDGAIHHLGRRGQLHPHRAAAGQIHRPHHPAERLPGDLPRCTPARVRRRVPSKASPPPAPTYEQIRRIVAMVDGLADRGGLDALLAPLRPRLAVLHPARKPSLRRLLFVPIEPLIVPPGNCSVVSWRSCGRHLGRSASWC